MASHAAWACMLGSVCPRALRLYAGRTNGSTVRGTRRRYLPSTTHWELCHFHQALAWNAASRYIITSDQNSSCSKAGVCVWMCAWTGECQVNTVKRFGLKRRINEDHLPDHFILIWAITLLLRKLLLLPNCIFDTSHSGRTSSALPGWLCMCLHNTVCIKSLFFTERQKSPRTVWRMWKTV